MVDREIMCGMRRVALLLVALLVTPLSSAWPIPELPEIEGEWVIVERDGWTNEEWKNLRDEGLEPLRQISETEVIVWGSFGDFQLPEKQVLRGPIADGYRVILEPRLPSNAQWGVLSLFDFQNLILAGDSSASPTTFEIYGINPDIFDSIPGIWWVEPILETEGRSDIAASIMQNNSMVGHLTWDLGLNGNGVVVGMADSGIELDHGCFRDGQTSIGEIGINHRKIILMNSSIDGSDNSSHEDFRHGTHLAGTIVCDIYGGLEGTGVANGSRLVFQDVVNDSGWSEPEMDWLLAEDLVNGAVIHSYSWGDATESYTSRSWLIDAWHREIPWSLAFIAPGNNPSKLYEPANARNVVSVGGTMKDNGTDLFTGSSHGPTEEGLRGNFIVTPAVGIVSAAADGNISSFNDDMRSSTGTSSSTALGAGMAAIIQQMVQDDWFIQNGSFVPSGPQLRVLLAMSAQSMEGGDQGGEMVGSAPNSLQGWGRPNLVNLINNQVNNEIWIHDSYKMNETQRMGLVSEWLEVNASRPFNSVEQKLWNGVGAEGPFLKKEESIMWNLSRTNDTDLEVFLSFNQRPFGQFSDDLNLVVTLPNGSSYETNDSLEGTEGLKINSSELNGVEWVSIEVVAKNVGVGNYTNMLGNDGDMLGFALAVKGVNGNWIGPEPEPGPAPEPAPEPICVEGEIRPAEDGCNDCVCGGGVWVCTEVVCKPSVGDKNPGKNPGKVNEDSFGMGKGFFLRGIGICLVLILVLVGVVARFSIAMDSKREKKEIDEQISINENKS